MIVFLKTVGDTVHQGDYIYRDNYEDDGNFSYGVNLKAVYLAYKNMTYEDGVVISKSAALHHIKLRRHYSTETIFFLIFMVILKTTSHFPKVGDYMKN